MKPTATARAVRAGLLVSTAVLALAGSGIAFAGTCVATAPLAVTCSGAFTNSVDASIPPANNVPNLTLTLDDTTTVDPSSGVTGLTANWGGDVGVLSYADITTDSADGIYMYGSNTATLSSYGDIVTVAGSSADHAIEASAFGDVYVTVGGAALTYAYGTDNAISVIADSNFGDAYVAVLDTGTVGAYAYAGTAVGVVSVAYGNSTVTNDGAIVATSTYGYAEGAVSIARYGDSTLTNTGTIDATGYYSAIGATVGSKYGNSYVDNSGDITATSSAYNYANTAIGVLTFGDVVDVNNSGSIYASASAGYYYGPARAVGVEAIGTDVYVTNTGDIGAYAYSYGYGGGSAIGVFAAGSDFVGVYNDGTISATFGGYYYGHATGLVVASGNTATIINTGDITATANYQGYAIGVDIEVAVSSYLYNSGSISAYGAYQSAAIYSGGTSDDTVYNVGDITGSIELGAGDDSLTNAAGGTINLTDGYVDMGGFAVTGNVFDNYGTINLDGSNGIFMGAGNPNAFYNAGVLNFQDGATGDYLYLAGDLAGDGDINVDVSGAHLTADTMYVYGNVAADSTSTINVALLDLPTVQTSQVEIVGVSGDSVAGNFALGTVDFSNNNFVNIDFSLIADIDATNATPDTFSLGMNVTGLSDAGTLSAAIAPSVLSLSNTLVGTWRQRMGVIDAFRKNGLTLWARVFEDKGTWSPEHSAVNFGNGGNFDWHQRNSGVEAGADFGVTENLTMGVLISKSKAKTHLTSPGVGNDDIDADSYGAYATWMNDGFYVDASYRWMDFRAHLDSVAGAKHVNGEAQIANIEAGYAFSLGGNLKLEPQAQYTSTKVRNVDTLFGDLADFQSDGGQSSRGRVGLSLRDSFGDADDGWMWTPYATLSAVREFDGESAYLLSNNSFAGTTSIKGSSALLELGFTGQSGNLAVYGGLNWANGGAVDNFFGGQLGVRYTFGGGTVAAPAPMAPPPAKTCADLDDDGDGVNNCDDKCPGSPAGTAVGSDGCPVPPPAPEPEPEPAPKPFRG